VVLVVLVVLVLLVVLVVLVVLVLLVLLVVLVLLLVLVQLVLMLVVLVLVLVVLAGAGGAGARGGAGAADVSSQLLGVRHFGVVLGPLLRGDQGQGRRHPERAGGYVVRRLHGQDQGRVQLVVHVQRLQRRPDRVRVEVLHGGGPHHRGVLPVRPGADGPQAQVQQLSRGHQQDVRGQEQVDPALRQGT